MSKKVLAFDYGASSGRAILASFSGGKIEMQEIHRFSNDPVNVNGTLYWDVLRLFYEMKTGIVKAMREGGFDAIGIDTWGVDFGLLDEKGDLLANPVHYRDLRTAGYMEKAFKLVPENEIYNRTGIQFMRFNTLFQLHYLADTQPELLARTDKMLFIPDLLAYFLTGEKKAEYTIASTSQMVDAHTGGWITDIMDKLGISDRILPKIYNPGTVNGYLSDDICNELGCPKAPVIAVCSHDTGSAVAAVPTQESDFAYISCGTWSLFGTELQAPVINDTTYDFNLTNEGGYNRTTRLLKNIMGLWLIQESRRQWIREGFDVSYADLEREALDAAPMVSFIDPDDASFETPGNLPRRVREYCKKTGQPVPETRGEIMRCIYESLAMKYRHTLIALHNTTGQKYSSVHVIGGGTKDKLLCRMSADACGCKVIAGPVEATAIGNIAVQFIALGCLSDIRQARKAVAESADLKYYLPENTAPWDEAYDRFLKILK